MSWSLTPRRLIWGNVRKQLGKMDSFSRSVSSVFYKFSVFKFALHHTWLVILVHNLYVHEQLRKCSHKKIRFAVFVDGYGQAAPTSLLSPSILQGQDTVRVSLWICSHRKERVRHRFRTRTWVMYGVSRRKSFSGFFCKKTSKTCTWQIVFNIKRSF